MDEIIVSRTRVKARGPFAPPRNCARVIPSLVPRSTYIQAPTFTSRLTQNPLSNLQHEDIQIEGEGQPGRDRPRTHSRNNGSIAHNHQHNPQCLTQHSPRRAYRPSFSAVLEFRSTHSHLRPRTYPKRSSLLRTVLWSGTLWTGAIGWELLVCLTWRIRYKLNQTTNRDQTSP